MTLYFICVLFPGVFFSACGGELYQTVVLEERLHEKHVIRMMNQVLEGVSFLHDRNIVHLDVKVS